MASLNSGSDSFESSRSEKLEGRTLGLAGAAMIATLASLAGTQQAQAQDAPPAGPAWECEWLDDNDGPGGKAPNAVKTGAPHADVGPAAVVEEESDSRHTTVRVEHGTTLAMRVICKTYPNLDQLRGLVGRILINGRPIPAADQAKIKITMEGKYPVIYIPFLAVDQQWSAYETDFTIKEGNAKRLMSDYERAVREGKALDSMRLKGEIKTELENLGRLFEQMKAYFQGGNPDKSSRKFEFPTADGNFMTTQLDTHTVLPQGKLKSFHEKILSLFSAFKSKFGGPQMPERPVEATQEDVRKTFLARVKGAFRLGGLQDGVTSDEGKLVAGEGTVEGYFPLAHWGEEGKEGSFGLMAVVGGGGRPMTAPGTHAPGPFLGLRGALRAEQRVSPGIYLYGEFGAGANFSFEGEEYDGTDPEGRPARVRTEDDVRPTVSGGVGIGFDIGPVSVELGYFGQSERPTAQPGEDMESDHGIKMGVTLPLGK